MKKIFLTCITLFSVLGLQAQFTLQPVSGSVSGSPNEFELVQRTYIKNMGVIADSFVWEMKRIDFKSPWSSAICDVLCYDTNVYTTTFFLNAGDSGSLDIHTYPNKTSGEGTVEITIYKKGNTGNKQIGSYYFSTWALGNKIVQQNAGFEFYPNPAINKLNINLDSDKPVTIEVFNVLGQLKIEHIHTGKTSVMDLSSLPTGIYFLRYVNSNGQTISKQFKKI